MQIPLSFTREEIEQLYLTYKNNPNNYQKIKDLVVGNKAQKDYKRNRKSLIFFFTAVTFIIIVSSSFSIVASHWDSLIALWMIWGIALVLFSVSFYILHKNTAKVYEFNEGFFQEFEAKAAAATNLEAFVNNYFNMSL